MKEIQKELKYCRAFYNSIYALLKKKNCSELLLIQTTP